MFSLALRKISLMFKFQFLANSYGFKINTSILLITTTKGFKTDFWSFQFRWCELWTLNFKLSNKYKTTCMLYLFECFFDSDAFYDI
jgi:hypothetical protein